MVQGGVKGATDVFSDEFTEVLPDAVHFTFELNECTCGLLFLLVKSYKTLGLSFYWCRKRDLRRSDIWWFVGLTAALQSWS